MRALIKMVLRNFSEEIVKKMKENSELHYFVSSHILVYMSWRWINGFVMRKSCI